MLQKRFTLGTLSLALTLSLLVGCGPSTTQQKNENPDDLYIEVLDPEPVQPGKTKAELLLEELSLREKVGQLFIIRPDALDFSLSQQTIDDPNVQGVTALSPAMKDAMQQYPPGGIIQFGKNLTSPEQITDFNQALQEASSTPLFLCIDEEGGLVSRLANHPAFALPKYQSAASVGQSGNPDDAKAMGNTIGAYLHQYGFNVDFAPDADVNTNPQNPIIGTRAFSSDAETAAQMAGAMAQGLSEQGVMPVYKHFPGHGDTKEDSHLGIAVTNKSLDELMHCELLPFQEANAADGIMVGHIAVPAITGDRTPATMSSELVTDLLKNQLGLDGLVITDSLSMEAITQSYTPEDAAITVLNAGCHVLLMPGDYRAAFDGVLDAVQSGKLSQETLDEAVLHILSCKEAHGLLP